ncbi:MAG: hypothetical protein HS111_23620 [Kofleriaceae bacterium]|nr:hypothetical protein [Kofleriaceae bacterium]MCL4227384.1 hypothetical protein [Myxococcales bacterium]
MRATAVAVLVTLLSAGSLAACGGQRFGRVITEVTPAPGDPGLLHVRTCDLVFKKADPEKVSLGDCKRFGLRRSAIVPVPVSDVAVPPREDRLVTGLRQRDGGGAVVTTCRLAVAAEGAFALVDCADHEISTATLATQPAAPPAGPGAR